MSEIKSLADQLRNKMAKPVPAAPPAKSKAGPAAASPPAIFDTIREMDISGCKTLVHGRFDAQTAKLLHQLKMATGIEVSRVLVFAVRQLLAQHPEIKAAVKAHLEQIEL